MSPRSGGTLAGRFPGVPWTSDRIGTREQSLEQLLAGLQPASADRARAAIGRILPDGALLTTLSQAELQEFLWYQLPLKSPAGTRELHEIAWSLADLFTVAGLERYAALCRAPQTHRLLDAWQDSDREPAQRSMKQAIGASGVDPPDTPLMSWGSVLGAAEQSARKRVSQALEQAIDAGDLVPGERGWRQLAVRITEVSLLMPRLDLRGASLVQSVWGERGSSWAAEHPAVRQDLLSEMLPFLASDVSVPVAAGACLMPLRWLLERIGDGVTLTRAGWLPKALVVEANDTFGWFDLFGVTVRTETDLPELGTLNELARRTRLITKRGSKVALSASGRRGLNDPNLLWRIVVADMFSAGTYEGEGAALAAATLVRAGMPVAYPRVEATVGAGLVGRWRTTSGEALEEWSGLDATREFGVLADVFGWVEQEDNGQIPTWTLTAPGLEAALLGLQLQARTPRNRV
jgi:hypothetical protein